MPFIVRKGKVISQRVRTQVETTSTSSCRFFLKLIETSYFFSPHRESTPFVEKSIFAVSSRVRSLFSWHRSPRSQIKLLFSSFPSFSSSYLARHHNHYHLTSPCKRANQARRSGERMKERMKIQGSQNRCRRTFKTTTGLFGWRLSLVSSSHWLLLLPASSLAREQVHKRRNGSFPSEGERDHLSIFPNLKCPLLPPHLLSFALLSCKITLNSPFSLQTFSFGH